MITLNNGLPPVRSPYTSVIGQTPGQPLSGAEGPPGQVAPGMVPPKALQLFQKADLNQSGGLSLEEMSQLPPNPMVARVAQQTGQDVEQVRAGFLNGAAQAMSATGKQELSPFELKQLMKAFAQQNGVQIGMARGREGNPPPFLMGPGGGGLVGQALQQPPGDTILGSLPQGIQGLPPGPEGGQPTQKLPPELLSQIPAA
jgi:hypothetical protein